MEDIVLETIMFEHPNEWGRRIVKRGNEILLQQTITKGVTWIDMPLPGFKLIVPDIQLKSTSDNPYAGLIVQNENMTKSTLGPTEQLKFSPEIQNVIDSGKLLAKRICSNEEVEYIKYCHKSDSEDIAPFQHNLLKSDSSTLDYNVEAITFLGGLTTFGLGEGRVYLDENRFLKLA